VRAAGAIGLAIARSLASDGARVFACDLLVDEVIPIAGRLNGAGEIIAAKSTLPARPPSLKSSARLAGPADLLVYGAGSVRANGNPSRR